MKAIYHNASLLFLCMFLSLGLSAQNDKLITDKIASFSDSRLPEKLLINIKEFKIDSLKKSINGSSSEIDTVFYNIGTVKYDWDIQFDSVSGKFTGKLNQ